MPTENFQTMTRSWDVQAGQQKESRSAATVFTWPPAKVSGGFITLPDGSKFRRTTNYSRSRTWVDLGANQNDTGVRRNIPTSPLYNLWLKSGPGGWNPDAYINAVYHDYFQQLGVGLSSSGLTRPPGYDTWALNEAQVKALLQLADSKAAVGENLATLGQTMRMLKNPVSYLVKGIKTVYNDKSLRPFIRESLASLSKQGPLTFAAERYLEFVYGWRPLMQDIYGLVNLAKGHGTRSLILSGSATSTREVNLPYFGWWNVSSKVQTGIISGSATSKTKCKLYARIDPNWSGTRALNQLGLANPLALAWELTTLSFVVDWLLPIGPCLNALSAPAGLAFINGSVSNRVTLRAAYRDHSTHVEQRANYSYNGSTDAGGTLSYEGYRRGEITSWPKPGVWIDRDPLRSDRSLKAIALLIASTKHMR